MEQKGNVLYLLDYDTGGNRLSKEGDGKTQATTTGLDSKVVKLSQGEDEVKFHNDLNGYRYLKEDAHGRKTFYLASGSVEYRLPRSGAGNNSPEIIVYLRKGSYSPIAQVDISNQTPQYTYYLRDHLGSPIQKLENTANASSAERYDAWGIPASASGSNEAMDEEHRGFTGHENIASFNLIHMNARMFDPEIALFLSPDKFIQGRSLASVNRFAYVHNNPVFAVDPSGWRIAKNPITIHEMLIRPRPRPRPRLDTIPEEPIGPRNRPSFDTIYEEPIGPRPRPRLDSIHEEPFGPLTQASSSSSWVSSSAARRFLEDDIIPGGVSVNTEKTLSSVSPGTINTIHIGNSAYSSITASASASASEPTEVPHFHYRSHIGETPVPPTITFFDPEAPSNPPVDGEVPTNRFRGPLVTTVEIPLGDATSVSGFKYPTVSQTIFWGVAIGVPAGVIAGGLWGF